MKPSPPKYSLSISLLLLAFGLTAAAQEKVTCRAEVVFHGQELTGRMMFKQVSEDTVRFAFFNELGMSFVEGSLAVRSSQFAVRSQAEIVKIADFLDYRSFRRNFERAVQSFLLDNKDEKLMLPVMEEESVEMTKIYQRGRKFALRLQIAKV
jgi:hypothetical protein